VEQQKISDKKFAGKTKGKNKKQSPRKNKEKFKLRHYFHAK